MSDKPMGIYKAMAQINKDINEIKKGDTGTGINYNFRGIDSVYNAIHSILAKNNVFCLPKVVSQQSEGRTSKRGAELIYRILTIEFTFAHEDGSSVTCSVVGEAMDTGDKASNKCMSVAHKYALFMVFTIPVDGMDDPDYECYQLEKEKNSHPLMKIVNEAGVQEGSVIKVLKAKNPGQLDALKSVIELNEQWSQYVVAAINTVKGNK